MSFACSNADESAQVGRADASSSAVIVIGTNYAYQAPDTISPGLTTFRFVNNSDQAHMAHLIRLEAGRDVGELIDAYNEAVRTVDPEPLSFTEYLRTVDWATRYGGPGSGPHTTSADVTQDLQQGDYAWICLLDQPDGVMHFNKGMVRPFVVTSTTPAPRVEPEADIAIRLVDYAFVLSTPFTVGRHTIRVENTGREPHELTIVKLDVGKTMSDLQAYLENPHGSLPASRVGGVSALDPTLVAYLEVDLTPGDYVLLCFLSAPDRRRHFAHGMILPFHVR